MTVEIVILACYVIGTLGVGLWASLGVRTSADYLVANRQLGLWVLVGTLSMTELNTMSLVGFTGYGYKAGIYATMIPLMFVVTFIFYMFVFAKRWKRFDAISTCEIFRERFASPAMSRVAALLWLAGLLLIVPNYMTGAAVILKMGFGISFEWSVILICGTIVIFTVAGGLRAVAYTDYVLMFLAILVLPAMLWYAVKNGGGWEGLTRTFEAVNPDYNHWNAFNMVGDPVLDFNMLIGWILACFWVFQMAQWYGQRMFAARDEATAYSAMAITAVLVYLAYASAILVAAFVRVKNPAIGNVETEPPLGWAIMNFVDSPIWRGLMLANILAIAQTTISSVWNAMIASVIQDLYKGWFRPRATDEQLLKESRWLTVALAAWTVFAAIFIIHRFTGVVRGTALANAFMFIPAIPCFLGFIWRRYTRRAAWTSIGVSGVLSIGIAAYKGIYLEEPFFFEVFAITAAVSIIAGVVVTWLGEASAQEIEARERLYRKVGDPVFRSGFVKVFRKNEPSTVSGTLLEQS